MFAHIFAASGLRLVKFYLLLGMIQLAPVASRQLGRMELR